MKDGVLYLFSLLNISYNKAGAMGVKTQRSACRKKYSLEYYLKIAEQLVDHGVHTLAIKDMAGVLKPRAASILIGALRQQFPKVPIHVHTHDTAGTGVATQLAAASAGADIIDCCIDSMAGLPSFK